MLNKTFAEIRSKLLNGQTTCQEIVGGYLRRIEEDKHLNVFITLKDIDALMRRSEEIDERVRRGVGGPLAGMVVAVKDAITVEKMKHTAGSRILENYTSPYSATAITRLEDADAIVIGKANMDEFAMGSSNENSFYGPVLNPHDPSRVAGGSSGGSAVAVAAGMATTSLGSETGGSVRLPASFCGVVGLKPTYGRISRYGLTAFASSFDQIGCIGNTVYDTALLAESIAGYDELDSTTSNTPVEAYSTCLEDTPAKLRVGIPKEYFSEGMDSEVRSALEGVVEKLGRAGAEIVDVSLPHTEFGIATYYVLVTAEASSNLARFDGIRYTYRSPSGLSVKDLVVKSRSEGFGPEVKRRIMLGTFVLSAGYYDAYYRKAQKVRTLIRGDFLEAFKHVDCLVAPTSPTVAFRLGEKTDDPLTMYLSDVYTVNINIAGIPALTVPCGQDRSGMPIGVQVIGPDYGESICFRVGRLIESLYSTS